MVLARLELRNFQRHRRLSVPLSAGVTTIVGPTDAGKSAVLRALGWVCFNEPRGESFRRHGGKRVSVALEVDGRRVGRSRGKGNTYSVDGGPLRAFGNDVPDEVQKVLNVGRTSFQRQHDPAYWLSKAPGEVSRELNAIVDLGVIDTTLANLASATRSTQAEARVVESRLEEARAEVRPLRRVEGAAEDLARLEERGLERDASLRRAEALLPLLAKARALSGSAEALSRAASAGEEALARGRSFGASRRRGKALLLLAGEGRAREGPARVETPSLRALEDLRALAMRASKDALDVVVLVGRGRRAMDEVAAAEIAREEAGARLNREARGKRCPLCEGVVK